MLRRTRIIPAIFGPILIALVLVCSSNASAAPAPYANVKVQWFAGDQSIMRVLHGAWRTCIPRICGSLKSANSADGNGRTWFAPNPHEHVLMYFSFKEYVCRRGGSVYTTPAWHYAGRAIPDQMPWHGGLCRLNSVLVDAHWA